ncbi:MAG: hypothetical protein II700_02825 [Firmicutes bacterium]|nr:hypothetical protein [Bacillota bacterium]
MIKTGIIGAGRLGTIIKDAIEAGLAPECELVGVASRSLGTTPLDLVEKGAKIVIEASKPEVLREYLIPLLERGVTVIPLSTGALADEDLLEKARDTARRHGGRVVLPHGAEGGFDLAATFALVPGMKGTIVQYVPERSTMPDGNPMKALPEDFKGTALEGFALSPSHLNVVIETAIACGGFENARYETRIPADGRSAFSLELENDAAEAVITVKNKAPRADIPMMTTIALSAVSTLNRITQPVTF